MYILDPTNQSDNNAFAGIRDLANIKSDNAAIDANPLFQYSENFIVDLLPDAKLRSPTVAGTGRTYPKRPSVISALQFLTTAFMLRAGGSVGSESDDTTTERSGTLRSESETIGPISWRRDYSTSESSSHRVHTEVTHESRSDWLETQAHIILEQLGAKVQALDIGELVVLTDSKLDEDVFEPEDARVIGDQTYIRR